MEGIGTRELHLGHLGLFFMIITYDKQPGHPAAIGDETSLSSLSSSWVSVSLIDDEEDEYEGDDAESVDFKNDDLFLIGSFSALSSADFTLSRVHTLW